MNEVDVKFVDDAVERIGRGKVNVLELLQALQGHYGYLPVEGLERICELTEITPSSIAGISTFYDQFRHSPCGKHTVRVCVGTACHVKGASLVYDAFLRHLKIEEGRDTDPEGLFTIEKVACLGCCMLAPVIQIDDIIFGNLRSNKIPDVIDDFLRQIEADRRKTDKPRLTGGDKNDGEIRICLDSSCIASGSGKVYEALLTAVEQTGLNVAIKNVGCSGMSFLAPLVEVITPEGVSFRYAKVQHHDAKAILLRHFTPRHFGKRIKNSFSVMLDKILVDKGWHPITDHSIDYRDKAQSAYLSQQKHLATENFGDMDPVDLEEYISKGGFEAFKRSIGGMEPGDIIAEMEKSGLRGRGGAGFPSYLKWRSVAGRDSETKYIVCNGDEGDPGAFMDRMLMESYPLRVIEGIAIAARTVGASEGFLYIRAEYPLAVKRIEEAIEKCVEAGYLGDDILGSGFSLSLKIVEGAGAFVCGEESALMASIEGKRGMPRLRPPFPAESGLWGKPTLINNVESYSAVPWIIKNGGEKFAEFGTEKSSGTKVFALAGKVANGGLIEVPMGISLREIVEDIGGGVAEGRKFKAVQIGGPSGGCIPASKADISVDYESLTAGGAIMGSGGLVVLDDTDCMVDISRYFLEFTQDQSCGKCTFCRVGTRRMLDVLERLCNGEGKKGDVEKLYDLSMMVKKGSLCGLGKTAPNPVLSTIENFRDEYEAHIEGRCPAGKCKGLITYSVTDDCIGCTVCAQRCPADAIEFTPYVKHEIDMEKCIGCDTCRNVCPVGAVKVE